MVTGGAFRLVLLLSPLVLSCRASDDELTFEQLFTEGKRAYSQKQWYDCVAFLRRAVEDFNHYNSEVLWCRENCERQIPASNVTGMAEIHRTAQRALCLFSASRPIHRRHLLWFDMEERLPYRFMHICYWHLKDLSNAVKAAFTYLVRNPGHEETLENIEEGFKSEMLIDLQQKQYEVLEEDRRCRLDCQDKLDWSSVEGTLEMDIIATSMRASVLRCESSCLGRLAWVNGHNVGNIIASHFEYLHISMRGTDACASVANYLLFDDSIAMRRNKFVYLKKYDRADLFTPTEEMLALHRRVMLEKRLLSFIDREFKFLAHAGNDRARWDEYVDLEDKFPYDKVETLLGPGECKVLRRFGSEFQVLRAPIRTRVTDLLIEELAESVRQNLGLALSDKHEAHVSCSSVFLEAHCPRPLVLSVDEKTCSQWLPPIHSGCSIVFCIA